jgi:hypothetical protein
MRGWRFVAGAVGVLIGVLTTVGADAAGSGYGQVYLMCGFLGPVLTRGLDELSAKLDRRGVHAPVYPHGNYDALADEAIAKYRAGNHGPIIIIGHSLGAVAAIDMAKKLQQNRIPVSLIVTFGPNVDLAAPANVTSAVNYYQSKSYSNGRMLRGPGFHGSIANVDLEKSANVNHLNMVYLATLQAQTISRVLSLVGGQQKPAATPAAVAAPATAIPAAASAEALSNAGSSATPAESVARSKN